MDGPLEYRRLACDCGSELFMPVYHLKYKAGSGMPQEPAGYVCQACHGHVDAGHLIKRLERKFKQAELRALEEEIRNEEAPRAPAAAKPTPESAAARLEREAAHLR